PGMAHRYREGEYDIRKDEDQEAKEAECLQLLVSAGYFRARIRGLSAFDKLVGGLCWCVQGCSVDIDADLLFHEGSSIGQKIALTEKIVRALRRMRCPHAIEPHQIQGRDFVHVFPVVQWLVTQRCSPARQSAELAAAAAALADRRAQLKAAFPTQRRLRKPAAYRGAQVPEETQSTMADSAQGSPVQELVLLAPQVLVEPVAALPAAQWPPRPPRSSPRWAKPGSKSGWRPASWHHLADIQRALLDFGVKQTELAQQMESLRQLSPEQQQRVRDGMEERLETARRRARAGSRERRDVEVARVAAAEQQRADFAAQLSALGAVAQDPRAAARLDRLVAAAEELRQREAEQKATLRAEAAELEAELARLRDRAAAAGDVEAEAANSERVAKATEQAAAAAERWRRPAPSWPRRAAPAPRCAAELMSSPARQTERSPAGRQELAGQLEKIVESARQNQSQAERRLTTEKAKRDGLNSEYLRLVESERRYNKLVKDFRAEAAKNERLSALSAA
uniref:Coiled-coil domain-containing protein 93 n=1 Tax=Macrostomum lignano TaxID=282301 RepID=A0A1I8FHM0_9PLAT